VCGEVCAKPKSYTTPISFPHFHFTTCFSQDVEAPRANTYLQRRILHRFLKKHNNGVDLLPEKLENPASIPEDITRIQVDSFKNPFQEIACLFTKLIGQESTATISSMILFILYFIVKE
jgi:hypothetical protein